MPGVGRRLVAPLVLYPDAILAHQLVNARQGNPVATPTQLSVDESCLACLSDHLMTRANQHPGPAQQSVACGPAFRRPTKPQSRAGAPIRRRAGQATERICATSRSRHISQQIHREIGRRFSFDLQIHLEPRHLSAQPGQLHLLDNDLLAPAGFSLPAFAALTQLRSVCSTNPSSSATRPMLPTSSARLTACSLNSAVCSCFETRFTSLFLSLCRSCDDYVGGRN